MEVRHKLIIFALISQLSYSFLEEKWQLSLVSLDNKILV